MKNVLVISNSSKSKEFFNRILSENHFSQIVTVSDGGEARRLLIENDFDLCIINAPLPDENGIGLARNIMTKGSSQVVLIVNAQQFDEVSSKVEDVGVFTVSKPINKALFWNILKLCCASLNKMEIMQKRNDKLVRKIEDIKIIDRAKCILIEYLKMSEFDAHKYIERQAMDMRLTKRAVAENVLKVYES